MISLIRLALSIRMLGRVKEVTYYDDQHSHWVVQIAGRHAFLPKTPFGDRDARRARFPDYQVSPTASHAPTQQTEAGTGDTSIEKQESPWRSSIRGESATTEDTTPEE